MICRYVEGETLNQILYNSILKLKQIQRMLQQDKPSYFVLAGDWMIVEVSLNHHEYDSHFYHNSIGSLSKI